MEGSQEQLQLLYLTENKLSHVNTGLVFNTLTKLTGDLLHTTTGSYALKFTFTCFQVYPNSGCFSLEDRQKQ